MPVEAADRLRGPDEMAYEFIARTIDAAVRTSRVAKREVRPVIATVSRRHLRMAGWAAVLAAAGVSLATLDRGGPVGVAWAEEPRQLAQNLRRAGSGTGFVVSRSGYIVTNDHLVSQCREMRVPAAAKIGSAATVIARDQINDLALLKVNGSPKQVATFRDGRSVRIGEDIVVYGFPLRGLLASSGNLTVGIVSALSGIRGDTRHLQITAPVQAGNSGGPLLDRSGNVVGVVVAKLNAVSVAMVTGDIPQNINFAIKRGMVESFLDVHHVPYETRPSKASLKVVEVSDRAAKITVVVECWK